MQFTTTIETLQARIIQLEQELHAAYTDTVYGCFNRAGINRRWQDVNINEKAIVFIDLDYIHEMNATHGYEEVDRRIRAALDTVKTRCTDVEIGRWYSGDEIIFIIPRANVKGFKIRLRAAFRKQGINASVGSTPCVSNDLRANVKIAQKQVSHLKKKRKHDSTRITTTV